jgi:hypothetical protein
MGMIIAAHAMSDAKVSVQIVSHQIISNKFAVSIAIHVVHIETF